MTLAELKTLLETTMRETGKGGEQLRFHVVGTGPLNFHTFVDMHWSGMYGMFVIVVEDKDEQSGSRAST